MKGFYTGDGYMGLETVRKSLKHFFYANPTKILEE